MNKLVRRLIKLPIRAAGLDLVRRRHFDESPDYIDISPEDKNIIRSVRPYTMTSVERVFSLMEAVRYVVRNNIPGEIVECGVWRGGSMLSVAKTLVGLECFAKHLFLFDTFEGMTMPTEADVSFDGKRAALKYEATKCGEHSEWCYASELDVRRTMSASNYPPDKIHFVKGKVEDTLPDHAPPAISLLRLDTDWYESTKHELTHLYPRLSSGGVLIIDDYGHWQGARKAVDEYFAECHIKVFLNRIDYAGRICVKP